MTGIRSLHVDLGARAGVLAPCERSIARSHAPCCRNHLRLRALRFAAKYVGARRTVSELASASGASSLRSAPSAPLDRARERRPVAGRGVPVSPVIVDPFEAGGDSRWATRGRAARDVWCPRISPRRSSCSAFEPPFGRLCVATVCRACSTAKRIFRCSDSMLRRTSVIGVCAKRWVASQKATFRSKPASPVAAHRGYVDSGRHALPSEILHARPQALEKLLCVDSIAD